MRIFRQLPLLVSCVALSSLIRAQPAVPVVRSGVDLVLIDAVILDDDGYPIRDLQPADIDVRVDGIARPVQWMQPIGGAPSTAPISPAAPVRSPAGETQARGVTPSPLVPRWFVVVVDRESIAAGGGQALLDAAGSLIEGLPSGDRVAVWVTPSAARSLQFRTPRDVLARTVRASTGLRGRPNTVLAISPDEGLAILDGDMQLLADVTRRECIERGLSRDFVDCGGVARREAEALGRETRDQLRVSLDTLQAIVGALGALDGPKHVVMISGPLAAGKEETRWLGDIERIANASRLTIHSVLTTPTYGQIIDAESRTSTLSLSLTTTMHASAAAGLAGATGGRAWSGDPREGVRRLLGEVAGTWVLAIDAMDRDKDDREHRIEVKALRRGTRVLRARRGFRIALAAPAPVLKEPDVPPEPGPPVAPPEPTVAPLEPTVPAGPGDISDADVLDALRRYVVAFETSLATVVLEERYVQLVKGWTGMPRADRLDPALEFDAGPKVKRDGLPPVVRSRHLRSDLLLVQAAGGMWTGYRDVFEVDRRMVRDRADRLQRLFLDGPKASEPKLQRIADESARYNVGSVRRTVNLPTLPVFYLHPRNATRMEFTSKGNADVDGVVCRVFEFREQAWPTIVVRSSGDGVPAWGQVWIEPVTGAVRRAVMRFDTGSSTRSSVDVRYRKADRLPVLVPSSLWEWYQGAGNRGSPDFLIEGLATYSNLRRFTVETSEVVR